MILIGFTSLIHSLTHFTSLHNQLGRGSLRDPLPSRRGRLRRPLGGCAAPWRLGPPIKNESDQKIKNLKFLHFFTQKEHPAPQKMKFTHKKQKTVLPMRILKFENPHFQLHQILKPIKKFFCTTVTIYHIKYISKL